MRSARKFPEKQNPQISGGSRPKKADQWGQENEDPDNPQTHDKHRGRVRNAIQLAVTHRILQGHKNFGGGSCERAPPPPVAGAGGGSGVGAAVSAGGAGCLPLHPSCLPGLPCLGILAPLMPGLMLLEHVR